ncbi:MAG: response regulator transcription factor [Anaerolineae bacterium]
MIRILVTDDHQLFREGIKRILSETPDMEVLATLGSGEEAVRCVPELRPDVILMDVNMPGIGGLEATRQIHARFPETKIIMLTVSEKESDLFGAIRAGARGFLLKNVTMDALVEAIQRVDAGEAMLAPSMAIKLLDEFAATSPPANTTESAQETLTDREREVLQHVARGLSNKEIGVLLSLSPHTIKAHLRTILDKLHLRGRAEAAAWAERHGLNPSDSLA